MLIKLLKKVGKSITIESLVRLSARLTADILYFSLSRAKNPKVVIGITATSTILKKTSIVAKKYKRTDFSRVSIFEDSIDAVTDAY